MTFGGLIEHLAKEREGLEHIGLIDAGQLARPAPRLAAFGKPEGKLEQAFRGFSRDYESFARLVIRDDAFSHRGEQAFGGFPDYDEIDATLIGANDRARHARNETGRAHTGIEVEVEP